MPKSVANPLPDPLPSEGGSYLLDPTTGKWELLSRTEPAASIDAEPPAKPTDAELPAEPRAAELPAEPSAAELPAEPAVEPEA